EISDADRKGPHMLPRSSANAPDEAIRPAYSSSMELTPIGSYEKIARKIDALQLLAAQDPPPGTKYGMVRVALVVLVITVFVVLRVGRSNVGRQHRRPAVPLNFAAPPDVRRAPHVPRQQVDQERVRQRARDLQREFADAERERLRVRVLIGVRP